MRRMNCAFRIIGNFTICAATQQPGARSLGVAYVRFGAYNRCNMKRWFMVEVLIVGSKELD
jgi:hypothetical protein